MTTLLKRKGLSTRQAIVKRSFDLLMAVLGLLTLSWLILLTWILASIDAKGNGFFVQKRVGRNGRLFDLVKIKTMITVSGFVTTVTQVGDPRITGLGRIMRMFKLDELPQLWNVLKGDMSLVGPRPDVSGFADRLTGEERLILSVRPGITGPASIRYRNEENILANQDDPEDYNRKVIWPDKVRINLEYVQQWKFRRDLYYICQTVFGERTVLKDTNQS